MYQKFRESVYNESERSVLIGQSARRAVDANGA
jgi:hypothetical protein